MPVATAAGYVSSAGTNSEDDVGDTVRLSAEKASAIRRWAAASGCRLCVHFGSTASGSGGVDGDVDVALDFECLPDPQRRLQIIGELQDLCAPRQADVIFLHADTDPVVRFEIFRTGRPLHEAHPNLFVEETVHALALYEDALPFRRALRKQLKAPGLGASR